MTDAKSDTPMCITGRVLNSETGGYSDPGIWLRYEDYAALQQQLAIANSKLKHYERASPDAYREVVDKLARVMEELRQRESLEQPHADTFVDSVTATEQANRPTPPDSER